VLKRQLRYPLLRWFRQHQRPLPWRQTRDPYHIWISEIMLQQTRVQTVLPYYLNFLRHFPTLPSLADSSLEPILLLWSGLGYYSRARNLRETAGILQARYNGSFPADYAQLRALPGIGDYTAAAILSIAFNQCHAVIDGNVTRVLARLFQLDLNLSRNPGKKQVARLAQELISPSSPGDFNQALMELGATLCTPHSPDCPACPWTSFCRARLAGAQGKIPQKKRRAAVEIVDQCVFVIHHRERILLFRRQGARHLRDFWDFPFLTPRSDEGSQLGLAKALKQEYGVEARALRKLTFLEHGITRFRFRIQVWHAEIPPDRPPMVQGDHSRWVRESELGKYPMAVAARKIAAMVRNPDSTE